MMRDVSVCVHLSKFRGHDALLWTDLRSAEDHPGDRSVRTVATFDSRSGTLPRGSYGTCPGSNAKITARHFRQWRRGPPSAIFRLLKIRPDCGTKGLDCGVHMAVWSCRSSGRTHRTGSRQGGAVDRKRIQRDGKDAPDSGIRSTNEVCRDLAQFDSRRRLHSAPVRRCSFQESGLQFECSPMPMATMPRGLTTTASVPRALPCPS